MEGSPSSPTPDAPIFSIERISSILTNTLQQFVDGFVASLPQVFAGLLILILTGVLAAIAQRVSHRMLLPVKVRESLKELGERFITFVVWFIGLMVATMIVFPDISPGDALAALGIGSIAIGLAFKDIFENFFAGVLILWRFPFENGDFIECDGHMGKVVSVTVRNTLIRTVEGVLLVIPNATIYKSVVRILTHSTTRRQSITCGIAYGESVAEGRRIIKESVEGCKSLAPGRPVEIFAMAFGASSIDFEVAWWCGSKPYDIRASRDEVIQAVKEGLDNAGIEIPFPYRTLVFKDGGPVRITQTGSNQPLTGENDNA
ncbi:MAG: mechanosensitive ion channel family protein [Phycisphaeraceae bacterium]